MVTHYFPQSFKGEISSNTNYPPQGSIGDQGIDTTFFIVTEDLVNIITEDGIQIVTEDST